MRERGGTGNRTSGARRRRSFRPAMPAASDPPSPCSGERLAERKPVGPHPRLHLIQERFLPGHVRQLGTRLIEKILRPLRVSLARDHRPREREPQRSELTCKGMVFPLENEGSFDERWDALGMAQTDLCDRHGSKSFDRIVDIVTRVLLEVLERLGENSLRIVVAVLEVERIALCRESVRIEGRAFTGRLQRDLLRLARGDDGLLRSSLPNSKKRLGEDDKANPHVSWI